MRQLCASWRLRRSSTELTSDRHDTTRMPIEMAPHWMIMWPFDPKNTGLPTTHKATGAYIMWAGSPSFARHGTPVEVSDGEKRNDRQCQGESR
jgi:hypothetical protein